VLKWLTFEPKWPTFKRFNGLLKLDETQRVIGPGRATTWFVDGARRGDPLFRCRVMACPPADCSASCLLHSRTMSGRRPVRDQDTTVSLCLFLVAGTRGALSVGRAVAVLVAAFLLPHQRWAGVACESGLLRPGFCRFGTARVAVEHAGKYVCLMPFSGCLCKYSTDESLC